MDTLLLLSVNTLYLLALINPVSKIAVLSSLPQAQDRRLLSSLVCRSTFTAIVILVGAMTFGNFLLQNVFHVQLHALRVAGGTVLFWVGFNALRHGVFFEQEKEGAEASDLALVPLACPMIAGPATIAASITLVAKDGLAGPAASVLIALWVNALLMLYVQPIAAALKRLNFLGAIIRITGLIVMTMGTQMVFDGLAQWQGRP